MQKNMEQTENVPQKSHNSATIGAHNNEIARRSVTMTDVENRAAALVVQTIVETIEEVGDNGAPLGIMYAALMDKISYETFVKVISALEQASIIKVRNNCAYPMRKH
jgi:hypothetical protein